MVYYILIAVFFLMIGMFLNRLISKSEGAVLFRNWSNRDLDSTLVAIGMLIIFGQFVWEADVSDKDVFTRLVELFNGVWLLILGFLFGKKSNGGDTDKASPNGEEHKN